MSSARPARLVGSSHRLTEAAAALEKIGGSALAAITLGRRGPGRPRARGAKRPKPGSKLWTQSRGCVLRRQVGDARRCELPAAPVGRSGIGRPIFGRGFVYQSRSEPHLRRAASGCGSFPAAGATLPADVVAELASLASPAPPSGGIARGGRVAAYPAERKRQSERRSTT